MADRRGARRLIAAALAVTAVAAVGWGAFGAAARRPATTLRHPIARWNLTVLPFGTRSHWIQPWRAYLDTTPATTLLNAVGINFNVDLPYAAATARVLAANGF